MQHNTRFNPIDLDLNTPGDGPLMSKPGPATPDEVKLVLTETIGSSDDAPLEPALGLDEIISVVSKLPPGPEHSGLFHRIAMSGPRHPHASQLRRLVMQCSAEHLLEKDAYGRTPAHYARIQRDDKMLMAIAWAIFLSERSQRCSPALSSFATSLTAEKVTPVVEQSPDLIIVREGECSTTGPETEEEEEEDPLLNRRRLHRQHGSARQKWSPNTTGRKCQSTDCGEKMNLKCAFGLCKFHCRTREEIDDKACNIASHRCEKPSPRKVKPATKKRKAPETTGWQICNFARCKKTRGDTCSVSYCKEHCRAIRQEVRELECKYHQTTTREHRY